ncbi:MAG: hypothetical protein VX772_08865 [Bacteroidota bacterium]|nr:hypothetical protein [Bacteroidota bacterium]
MEKKFESHNNETELMDEVIGLLNPRKRRYHGKDEPQVQEVVFKVENNSELRYVISCLLRLCMSTIDNENELDSPRLPFLSKDDAVITILELVIDILPDDQLDSYDRIEKLLLKNKHDWQPKMDELDG